MTSLSAWGEPSAGPGTSTNASWLWDRQTVSKASLCRSWVLCSVVVHHDGTSRVDGSAWEGPPIPAGCETDKNCPRPAPVDHGWSCFSVGVNKDVLVSVFAV